MRSKITLILLTDSFGDLVVDLGAHDQRAEFRCRYEQAACKLKLSTIVWLSMGQQAPGAQRLGDGQRFYMILWIVLTSAAEGIDHNVGRLDGRDVGLESSNYQQWNIIIINTGEIFGRFYTMHNYRLKYGYDSIAFVRYRA